MHCFLLNIKKKSLNETPLAQIKLNQMYNKLVEYYWDIRYRFFLRFRNRRHRECGYLEEYEKYKDLINEFIDSNKPFAAGFHESHHFPMSDLMLFKRDILNSLLPILPNVYPDREKIEFLQNEYRGTQLGFNNVEEWILNALYKQSADHPDDAAAPNKIWHRIQRDGHPRYRFTEKYAFGHLHDDQEKRGLLKHYNATKGSNISQWVGR